MYVDNTELSYMYIIQNVRYLLYSFVYPYQTALMYPIHAYVNSQMHTNTFMSYLPSVRSKAYGIVVSGQTDSGWRTIEFCGDLRLVSIPTATVPCVQTFI